MQETTTEKSDAGHGGALPDALLDLIIKLSCYPDQVNIAVLSCPVLSSPLLSFCFILRFAQTLVLDSLRLCFWIRSGCILGFAQTLISDSFRLYAWIRSGCIRGFAQTLILDSLRCMFQFAQAFILDSLRPCPPAPPAPSHTRN